MGDLFNLRKRLVFYGSYHANRWNQLVHIIFVPIIVWTATLILAHQTDLIGSGLSRYHHALVFNAAFIFVAFYGVYYMIMDHIAGTAAAVLMLLGWIGANIFQQRYPEYVLATFIVGQIGSWTAQILSHKFIEGRAPAFFDDVVGALVLAPFFVFLEVLFQFGYRPDLNKQVNEDVQRNSLAFKASQLKKAQ